VGALECAAFVSARKTYLRALLEPGRTAPRVSVAGVHGVAPNGQGRCVLLGIRADMRYVGRAGRRGGVRAWRRSAGSSLEGAWHALCVRSGGWRLKV